jgi:hypothetical protein
MHDTVARNSRLTRVLFGLGWVKELRRLSMSEKQINAFNWKEYTKLHPVSMKTENKMKQTSQSLTQYVEKKRKTSPTHGTMFGISDKVVSVDPKQMMKGGTHGRKNDA